MPGIGYVYVSPEEINVGSIGIIQKGFMTSSNICGFIFYRLDGASANAYYLDSSTSALTGITPVFNQNESEIVYFNDTEIT